MSPISETLPPDESDSTERELEELKSMFVRNVGHELRTPVALIQGYADLLSEGALGPLRPEQEKAILIIASRAHKLRSLIERVTTLLAVKAEQIPAMPLALSELVANVVERRRPQAVQAGLTLTLHLAPALPPANGHPHHLQQVIDCLIENALKFTPIGGCVEIRLEAEPGWLRLSVTDTGIGIPPNNQSRIFNAFYQLDGSTTRQYDGIGLGLTVVKAVVEAYSGQIEVESQPNRGSRFIVKLPVFQTEAKEQADMTHDTQPKRILIVDDEPNVAMTLMASLEKLGDEYIFETANNGDEALIRLKRTSYILLITDYHMPGMNGLDLAQTVRQSWPQTQVILMTAYGTDPLRQMIERLSLDGYIDKPFSMTQIRAIVERVVGHTHQAKTHSSSCSRH